MSELDTPLSNVEAIIQNGLGASNSVVPMSRVENLLAELITAIGSSGGSGFVATITVDDTTYSCDKTYSEIVEASTKGPVICLFEDNGQTKVFHLSTILDSYVVFDRLTTYYDFGLETISFTHSYFEVTSDAIYYFSETKLIN